MSNPISSTPGTMRRYAVVGAGAIGGTLAHHLARAGHHVTVVDTDADHVTAIRRSGLTVVRGEQRAVAPVAAALVPGGGAEPDAPLERVLLAVKAQATGAALDWIEPRLATDGFVVSLQNGLNEATIAARVGSDRTVGAFVNLFADVVGPGEIRDGGLGALVVGELDGSPSDRVASVVDDLQAWGPARATGNVAGYLWSKLGFGAMLTATALVDAPMADLIDRHRDLMHALAAEVFRVAATQGIDLEPFDAFDPAPYAGADHAARHAATDALVAWLATQSKDRSGIWRDIAVRRRPTEVPVHYAEVLRVATRAGVPTPLLTGLLAHIAELESGAPMAETRLAALASAIPGQGATAPLPSPAALAGIDVGAVAGWVRAHRADLVEDLVALAGVETPSDDRGLLDKGLAFVEDWVTTRLGPPAQRALHDGGPYGCAVVLEYPGTGPGATARTLVALGHYDTVFDAGTLATWPVQADDSTVSGPGVFDMKGGLVQLIWALRALDRLGVSRPPVRLVLNGDEEIGSPASRPVIESAVTGAAAVLVFEGSADGGAVKTARKGVGLFDVTATGVESHAGLDPLAGASAIDAIATAVSALHAAADLDRGTSINVGVLSGGRRRNVVAGTAVAGIDVRVATEAEQDRVDGLLASLRPADPRVSLAVSGGWNRPVMTRTPEVATLYELARAAAARLGFDLPEASVGGASDGNFVAALGIPVLDGFGAVGAGAHARHEHVTVDGMVARTGLAATVIAAFARPAGEEAQAGG